MALTYFSASNIPWALPQWMALGCPGVDGVNERVGKWLLDLLRDDTEGKEKGQQRRVRGWAFMDFCDSEIVRFLVECNFRWRTHGEEGWI